MTSAPAPKPPRLAAFATAAGASRLEAARLTDRSRVAVLLQGAAVLAHLDAAGWHLGGDRSLAGGAAHWAGELEGTAATLGGWEGARVSADGVLRLTSPSLGKSRALHQDLLLDLIECLFGDAEVAGRGQAKLAARKLSIRWRQSLTALDADAAVAAIFELAPFLWQPPFTAARQALVGEHFDDERSHDEHSHQGQWRARLAGPARHRRRVAAAAGERSVSIVRLMAGEEARELWQGTGGTVGSPRPVPARVSATGRWQAALAAWNVNPPKTGQQRREMAGALFALGQFEQALAALHGVRGVEAHLLRAHCQMRLGQLRAAEGTLRRLEGANPSPTQLVEMAEVGARVSANLGKAEAAQQWVQRALAAADGPLAGRAHLLAALAEWDAGHPARMQSHLHLARGLLGDPHHSWKWRFATSLAASAAGDAAGALEELSTALRESRRNLRRFEAGQLWNEVGICRAHLGDLAGAEHAFCHTARLLGGCEGPRRTTLALYNLAEIRLRRGRLLGVEAIVEEATIENRLSSNLRGSMQDAELWARLEMARGRPRAALARCEQALEQLDAAELDWRRGELSTLAARALGWLGRPDAAAALLAQPGAPVTDELEAEELPALWALAGQRDAALRAATGTPLAPLWLALLTGEDPEGTWNALAALEPFRAARLVFDCELVAPGSAPLRWLRRAAATLRRIQASRMAARLETRDRGPWVALEHYLRQTSTGSGHGTNPAQEGLSQPFTNLLTELGYGEVSLTWIPDQRSEPTGDRSRRSLVAGNGAMAKAGSKSDGRDLETGEGLDGKGKQPERLSTTIEGGALVLETARTDDTLRALLALAAHDFTAPADPTRATRNSPRGGMVGESRVLLEAQERLALLAPGKMPVLIAGESGTGKELAARLVHRLSPRAERPFVAINCAALSETLLLSDLFGHVRGSFTGADRERAGVFETARGGTVFLDEIGDLPLSAQGMLLRVLQEGEVRRVGESLPRAVDVRVVSASHRDLAAMVEQGGFREDLYFRLKVAKIELPPLRERGEDLYLLADHFLAKFTAEAGTTPKRLGASARKGLRTHSWPGNVRELENVLTVAFALSGEARAIEEQHLELPSETPSAAISSYHHQVDELRRQLLTDALAQARGNQSEAARTLGLTRQALSYLVKQLRLS